MMSRQNSRSDGDPSSSSMSSNITISTALDQIKDKLIDAQKSLEKIDEVQNKSTSLQASNPTPLGSTLYDTYYYIKHGKIAQFNYISIVVSPSFSSPSNFIFFI